MDPTDPAARPHVLIVGGFLTEPFMYGPLRRRLLERGAASVTIAPVHVIDWLAAGIAGLGPLLVRTGLAVRQTHRLAGRAPLLVVGHSGGGILARLACSPVAFQGRVADVADAVGCLVTLGTPHGIAGAPVAWRHPGVTAAAFLDRVDATTPDDPRVATVTVGSTAVEPSAWRSAPLLGRLLDAPYRAVVGPIGPAGGDGIVGVDLAHLAGARQLTFSDVTHGTVGPRWYGVGPIVDRWWPVALDAWYGALAARAVAAPSAAVTPGSAEGPSAAAGILLDG